MLSIFSCAFWPCVCLLWRNIYLDFCPFSDWVVWGESRLAKMAHSGFLIPPFINNDCVTTEIVYSTVHTHYEVLTWSRATLYTGLVLCVHVYDLHLKKGRHYCCIMTVFVGSTTRGEKIVHRLLWLLL